MLLSEIKEGQTARILRAGGSGALRRRIFEMGIVKGTVVYVDKYAPLKDPIEIIVMGYHLSLRVEEASQITVEIIQEDDSRQSLDTPSCNRGLGTPG
ncbi:MAG: FeoA family protein [Desulfatirhabdiaceae bacterium]|nr:FeoA family protein [Desulfatirhabdiaceae bacterium]